MTFLRHVSDIPQSRKIPTEAPLTQISQICASWRQNHRVNHHDKPKSVLYNEIKLSILTINLTLNGCTCVTQAFKLYVHENYFIDGHSHPDI